jgi:hypothetical protein
LFSTAETASQVEVESTATPATGNDRSGTREPTARTLI